MSVCGIRCLRRKKKTGWETREEKHKTVIKTKREKPVNSAGAALDDRRFFFSPFFTFF